MNQNLEPNSGSTVNNYPWPVWKHTLILCINFLGFFGLALILYSLGVVWTGSTYAPFEKYAGLASDFLTLVGVFFIAISIYSPPNTRLPEPFSKCVSAPFVIIGVLGTLVVLCFTAIKIPSQVISGFALMGIAGSLFRSFSR